MSNPQNALRLNLGFIAHQPVGYQREFTFDYQTLHLPPDLDLDDFHARIHISRNYQGLLTELKTYTRTKATCVRCLNDFYLELSTGFTELFAFSKRSTTESELLLPEDGDVDFGALVREYLILETPISPLCTPDCKGLCPVCGENRNENKCQHDDIDIDPRLEDLKSLLGE